jgi:hypothetical protein
LHIQDARKEEMHYSIVSEIRRWVEKQSHFSWIISIDVTESLRKAGVVCCGEYTLLTFRWKGAGRCIKVTSKFPDFQNATTNNLSSNYESVQLLASIQIDSRLTLNKQNRYQFLGLLTKLFQQRADCAIVEEQLYSTQLEISNIQYPIGHEGRHSNVWVKTLEDFTILFQPTYCSA